MEPFFDRLGFKSPKLLDVVQLGKVLLEKKE